MQQFTYYSPTILRETLDGAAFVDLRSKLRSPCFSLPCFPSIADSLSLFPLTPLDSLIPSLVVLFEMPVCLFLPVYVLSLPSLHPIPFPSPEVDGRQAPSSSLFPSVFSCLASAASTWLAPLHPRRHWRETTVCLMNRSERV